MNFLLETSEDTALHLPVYVFWIAVAALFVISILLRIAYQYANTNSTENLCGFFHYAVTLALPVMPMLLLGNPDVSVTLVSVYVCLTATYFNLSNKEMAGELSKFDIKSEIIKASVISAIVILITLIAELRGLTMAPM